MAEYRRAEAIFHTLSTADPKDIESLVGTAATRAATATLLAKKGDGNASMASYRSSLAIVEPLSRAEPWPGSLRQRLEQLNPSIPREIETP